MPIVKLTIRIQDALHRRLTAAAEQDRRSVNGEIEWLLGDGLDRRDSQTTPETKKES